MELILGPKKYLSEFNFSIPETVSSIGIAVSGGLDSAVLLSLILTELRLTNRLHTVSVKCYTFVKTDAATYYARRVVQQAELLFRVKIKHENNIHNADLTHGRVDRKSWLLICRRQETDVFYWGLNRQVDKSVKEFKHQLVIDYGDLPDWDKLKISKAPFLLMKKPNMLDLFFKLGVESLIPLTHTCTRFPVIRCNDCYSCEERAWAFEELGVADSFIEPGFDISFGNTFINPAT